jgi:hypothetical protein
MAQQRADLGLQRAKLRFEVIGINLETHSMDGYVCPACLEGAEFRTRRDADGKFRLTITANKDIAHEVYE